MDSLRSFMDEMLNDQGRKEGFISDLLGNLKNQPVRRLINLASQSKVADAT